MIFLGREIGEQRNYSDEVAEEIDDEVRSLVDEAYGGPGRSPQLPQQAGRGRSLSAR